MCKEIYKEVFFNELSKTLEIYRTLYGFDMLDINIYIEEDISKKYTEIRPEHIDKSYISIEELRTYNGVTIPPKELDGKFSIAIDKEYFINSLQNKNWMGTLAHEATHVYDYCEFAKLVEANNYDEILDMRKCYMFHLWTEFHAKVLGYRFLRWATYKGEINESQLEFIINEELLFQTNYTKSVMRNFVGMHDCLYNIVQFMGRLYVWNEMFPEYFTDEKIKEIINSKEEIYELYDFFLKHMHLESAYGSFSNIESIVKKLWNNPSEWISLWIKNE